MRFIGSKAKLLKFIESIFRTYVREPAPLVVGDLFCGTAAVARHFKLLGHKVVANDMLKFCYVFAQAALGVNEEPRFESLFEAKEIPEQKTASLILTQYDKVLLFLNNLPGHPGFIYREYSPGGTASSPFQRKYFTDDNAQRIDAIRAKIQEWEEEGLLTEEEKCLLLTDLIRAANRVANIAGTYGCYLKHWDKRALLPITLERSSIVPSRFQHEIYCMDANELVKIKTFDVLYLDPPYTWRHYGAYYHILETIAEGDEPKVEGRTGIRPWEHAKSRYCDREDAERALLDLVLSAQCKHLFLSYNSEGLISHERILEILSLRGKPKVHEVWHRRYRSNDGGTRENRVKERLYYVRVEKDP